VGHVRRGRVSVRMRQAFRRNAMFPQNMIASTCPARNFVYVGPGEVPVRATASNLPAVNDGRYPQMGWPRATTEVDDLITGRTTRTSAGCRNCNSGPDTVAGVASKGLSDGFPRLHRDDDAARETTRSRRAAELLAAATAAAETHIRDIANDSCGPNDAPQLRQRGLLVTVSRPLQCTYSRLPV